MEKAVAFRTIMNEPYRDHPDDEALERFLLQQSEEDELEIVETHFLACEACITRLETLEFNIQATKLALQSLQQTELAAKLAQSQSGPAKWLNWLIQHRLSFAGASLAACAIAFTFISVPREFSLTANRGTETNVVSQWLPLGLHLNATDLPPGPVTVEVVDAQGGKIWQGGATVAKNNIDVTVPRLTTAGAYLVRVYSKQPAADMELLREFSIKTKPLF